MNYYYTKYLKYKIKYMNHKEFKEFINKNISDGLINIDFLHDNPSSKVKGKEFYDMINNKEINIYNKSKPEDLEHFIHNELIDLVVDENDTIFQNIFVKNESNNKLENLSEYICILDKSVNNDEMILKLKTIFSIEYFEQTFVGNCEKFLTSTVNASIDKMFLTTKKNLKPEYVVEAIKIGFLPLSKNQIINFNALNNTNSQTVLNELNKIKLYIDETLVAIKKVKEYFGIDFAEIFIITLKNLKKRLLLINNIDDVKNKYFIDDDKNKNFFNEPPLKESVEKVVFSLKEARDIYYIEEIKTLMTKNLNKKYILVSGDLVQSYRAIISNISTINVLLSIIRFMGIYNLNKLNIIGNPFELISSNKEIVNKYLDDNIKKDIIKNILSNPIINLRRNLSFNTKYFLNNYDRIYTSQFLIELSNTFVDDLGRPGVDEISSTELNLDKKKEHMDYLLNFAKNNIKDETDLLYVLRYLKFKSQNYYFDIIINRLNTIIQENTLDIPEIEGDIQIQESTWQFQIFYLCTLAARFSLMEYIIPVAKKLYPNEFNWNEVEQLKY
jgi:hypothetical protein